MAQIKLSGIRKSFGSTQVIKGTFNRSALGTAIVRKPKVFRFDEPLSNLDAALRMDMRMEIGKLHQQLGRITFNLIQIEGNPR